MESTSSPARLGTHGDAPDPQFRLTDSESCSSRAVDSSGEKSRAEKLWIAKGDDTISFAPIRSAPHKIHCYHAASYAWQAEKPL